MTDVRLRVTEADWNRVWRELRASFASTGAPEQGTIGVLGECRGDHTQTFLLAKLFPPGPGDLKVAQSQEIVFDASYIRRAHLFMRSENLAGLIFFHTHPFSDERVGFSYYDDHQEPLLVQNLLELCPSTRVLSVVAGRRSLCGRMWHSDRQSELLTNLTIVGENLVVRSFDGYPAPNPPSPAAAFDRAMAVTGAGALAHLARMTVAIVGASGTGSLIAELLVRAGCRRLLLLDDDIARHVNLNRILHCSADDVRAGTSKVELLKRELERIGLGCEVIAISQNILRRGTLQRLRDADVVFGCVDKAWP